MNHYKFNLTIDIDVLVEAENPQDAAKFLQRTILDSENEAIAEAMSENLCINFKTPKRISKQDYENPLIHQAKI